jgi:hypothetical protein
MFQFHGSEVKVGDLKKKTKICEGKSTSFKTYVQYRDDYAYLEPYLVLGGQQSLAVAQAATVL